MKIAASFFSWATGALFCTMALVEQPVRAASPAGDEGSLAEIVVTAQKVPTLESKTPISMEVYDGRELASRGITDVQSLAYQDPSINFDTGNGEGFVTIRGVASHDTTEIGDPAVPIATDGFFVNRPYIFNNSLYDISRIEVLRGPQGTLWGRNATGGLISLVTNEPGRDFGGYGEMTAGSYRALDYDGAINLPVSDKLRFRAAFSSQYHDGYRDIVGSLTGRGGPAETEDARSGRIKMAFDPTEHLSTLLTYQYTNVGGTGPVDNILLLPTDAAGNPTHQRQPGADTNTFILPFNQSLAIIDRALRWRATEDDLPEGISVTYLGGYDRLLFHHTTPLTPPDTTIALISNEDPNTWNHELRFNSAPGGRLQWQVGGFYYQERNRDLNNHFRDVTTPDAQPDIVTFLFDVTDKSYAGFGQASYEITPQVKLSAGTRYTHDMKSRLDNVANQLSDASWSHVTWHGGIDWSPSDATLGYFKVDTGYKAGGFNLFQPISGPTLTESYNPETITSYEAGTKNRLLDGKLSLNATAFYMDYQGQQLLLTNSGGVITENAKGSKLYGAEFQTVGLVEPVGRVDFSLSLLHARFGPGTEIANSLGTNQNISGNRLTQAPTISLGVGIEHTWRLVEGGITARLETKYQSSQYFDFFNFPNSLQKSYTNSGAHLRWNAPEDKWEAELFVRNIENARIIADENESYAPPENTYNIGFQPPRTYGLRIRANF